MAWVSITNEISFLPIALYIGAIFWTLGYDTIYGSQDVSDDEVIGVKSTAIKFKNNLTLFVGICYSISFVLICFVAMNLKINYFLIFLFLFMISLIYQLKILNIKKPDNCLKAFKVNNISGLFVFLTFYFLTI